MVDLESEVIARIKHYQTNPEASWEWLLTPESNDRDLREWFKRSAIHMRDYLYPRIKSKENLIDLYPVQIMWGYQSRLGSGIGTDRLYNYYYGTFGTGYMALTDQNCYVKISADLTEKCPLYESRGIVGSVLLGMLGERDKTKPTREDQNWKFPVQSIKEIRLTQDARRQECVEIGTSNGNFLIYYPAEIMIVAFQMIISEKIAEILAPQASQIAHGKNTDSLHALEQIKSMLDAGLISEEEYESKKLEILSRI